MMLMENLQHCESVLSVWVLYSPVAVGFPETEGRGCEACCWQLSHALRRAFLGEEEASPPVFWLTGAARAQPHSSFSAS